MENFGIGEWLLESWFPPIINVVSLSPSVDSHAAEWTLENRSLLSARIAGETPSVLLCSLP